MPQLYEPQFYILTLVALITSALTIYSVCIAKGKGKYLCQDCRFNSAKDCQKEERPMAFECTSYRPKLVVKEDISS